MASDIALCVLTMATFGGVFWLLVRRSIVIQTFAIALMLLAWAPLFWGISTGALLGLTTGGAIGVFRLHSRRFSQRLLLWVIVATICFSLGVIAVTWTNIPFSLVPYEALNVFGMVMLFFIALQLGAAAHGASLAGDGAALRQTAVSEIDRLLSRAWAAP